MSKPTLIKSSRAEEEVIGNLILAMCQCLDIGYVLACS